MGGKEKNKHRSKRDARNIGGRGKEIVLSLSSARGVFARIMSLPLAARLWGQSLALRSMRLPTS